MRTSPPPVLPDISPSRGEIGWKRVPQFNGKPESGSNVRRDPISPVAVEMSVRPEGGIRANGNHHAGPLRGWPAISGFG